MTNGLRRWFIRRRNYRAPGPVVMLLALGLLSTGCAPENVSIESAAPPSAASVAEETWDVILLQNQKVGYRQQTTETLPDGGRRISAVDRMTLQRFGETTTQEVKIVTEHGPTGQVRRVESQMQLGNTPKRTAGVVARDTLTLTRTTGAQVEQVTLPFPAGTGGYFAVEQSLRAKPMQPGERRTLRALLPMFDVIAEIELSAADYEPVELAQSPAKLLKIIETVQAGEGVEIRTELWADPQGQVLKQAQTPLTLLRTTAALARQNAATGPLDIGFGSLVKLAQPLRPGLEKRVYRVTLADDDPARLFVNGASQKVESLGPHEARVTVWTVNPNLLGNPDPPADPSTPADRAPSEIVQSADPALVRLANQAAPQGADAWATAVALEKFVEQYVTVKEYSQTFASAAEVAASREGDCTEHSVLLAALCRACGLPCRAAMGLVYMPSQQAFAYHMWNEVWINDTWIPLDATRPQTGTNAEYLKLSTTSLRGPTDFVKLLPVLQVLGKLKIEEE